MWNEPENDPTMFGSFLQFEFLKRPEDIPTKSVDVGSTLISSGVKSRYTALTML